MLIAAIFEEVSTALLHGGLFILFNSAFAGFILNLNNVPDSIRWLKWICPSRYSLEGIASGQLKGLSVVDNIGGVPFRASVSLFSYKLFGFEDDSYYRDLIVLACGFLVSHFLVLFFLYLIMTPSILFGFSILLFGTVYYRMRERR